MPGAAPPDWWDALHGSLPGGPLFVSGAWMRTWLESYGDRVEGEWLRWDDGGRVVAGCLLAAVVARKGPVRLRKLYFNATAEAAERTPLAEYNQVLCLPGYEEPVREGLVELLRRSAWDVLHLSGCVEGGFLDQAIGPALPAAWMRRDSRPAPYVDLRDPAFRTAEALMSANVRSQVRRCAKQYEARHGRIELTRASSAEEALRDLDALARLHHARWAARGLPGTFDDPTILDFHRRLIPRLWASDQVDLLRARTGDQDIGYLYNFRVGGKVYAFQSGFAYEKETKYKPGLLTHKLAIDHYADGGLAEYDFLAGDGQYKRSLANKCRTLNWTDVFRDGVKMRVLVALWKAKARLQATAA